MRKLFSSIFVLLLYSCTGAPTRQTTNPDDIKEFVKGTPYTHFASACWVYDFAGKMKAFVHADNCVIEPDGSYYSRTMAALRYTGPDQKKLWENPVKLSHHQIFHSKVSGKFLAINNEFKTWNNTRSRIDLLLLLNDQGKIIKKFSFYDYFKKHPELTQNSSLRKSNWFFRQTGVEKDIHELTHTNSFLELTRNESDGTTKVTGYLSNCTYMSKFYIFDPTLSEIVKVIDLNGRSTHAVSQIDNDRILFYRNSSFTDPYSSAEIYNFKTNEFTTLYKSNNSYLSAFACSSVQMLTKDKLMLSHSQCVPSDNNADYGVAVEFVDLKKKKSFYYLLHKVLRHSNAYLIDGAKFVESRPSP